MKKAFVFKKLMSKKINKKTVASIGSRAVLALALAIECCEEIETSIEASEEIEDEEDCKKVEVKPIQGKITEIKKVLKLFSEESSVKAIKKYLKKEKKIKDEEDVSEVSGNEDEATSNSADTTKNNEHVENTLLQLMDSIDDEDSDSEQEQSKINITDINFVLHKKNAPNFSGKSSETIFTWLHIVKTILSSNGIPKHKWVTLVLPLLKEGALDTAINYTLNSDEKDWDKFEKLLLNTYEPTNQQKELKRKLKYLTQGKKSILEFNTEFINLCNKIRNLKHEDRIEHYLEALSGKNQYAVENSPEKDIDLDKAMEICLKYESIFLKKQKPDDSKFQINAIRHNSKKFDYDKNRGSQKEIVCYFCKKAGHKSNVCRSKFRGQKTLRTKFQIKQLFAINVGNQGTNPTCVPNGPVMS